MKYQRWDGSKPLMTKSEPAWQRIGGDNMKVFIYTVITILLLSGAVGVGLTNRALPVDPLQTPNTQGELEIITSNGKVAGACPLRHTDVNAEISGFVARVDVTQEFYNPTQEKIEAVYTFPLPEDSAVDQMEMTVGSRTIIGEIHRREEAKEIYDAAREAGHVASLLDQERPNIFNQSVANIMPGEKVIIKISYTQMLKYEAGTYEFVFPMVVGPRFIPGQQSISKSGTGTVDDTDSVPDASKITPPVTPKGTRAGHDISVTVNINAGIPIYSAKCKSHEVDYEYPDNTSAIITLKDKATIPNKDFVLNYEVAGEMVQSGVITSAPNGNGGFFTLIMQPPKSPKPQYVTPKEMIFVIDTSGSQMGEPLEKSKETMLHCIKNVNPGDTFNMISFSNDVNQLFKTSQPYTKNNEESALKFLKDSEAGGGTYMLPAIKAALTPKADPNRLRIVVFFTDGYIGNDFEIIDCIQKNLGQSRIFSFGIGGSVNRFLIEKMAEEGRGASDVVLLGSDGKQVAEKFYNRIRNPILTDISVDWNGLPVIADEVYPKRTPDLFSSQPLVLKGRYTAPASGEIIVHAKVNGETWIRKVQVDFPERYAENDALIPIWARAKVDDLMSKDWMGLQNGTQDLSIKDQIIDVALDYNLMTQYTSFVAVEKMVVTTGGKPKTIAVPVEMPQGVSYEGVFGDGSVGTYVRKGSAHMFALAAKPSQSTAYYQPSAPTAVEVKVDFDDGTASGSPANEQAKDMNLDKVLQELITKYEKSGKSGKYSIPGKLEVVDGFVEVMIIAKDAPKDALTQLEKLGLKDSAWLQKDKILMGWIPVDKLKEIADLAFVAHISPPIYSEK